MEGAAGGVRMEGVEVGEGQGRVRGRDGEGGCWARGWGWEGWGFGVEVGGVGEGGRQFWGRPLGEDGLGEGRRVGMALSRVCLVVLADSFFVCFTLRVAV